MNISEKLDLLMNITSTTNSSLAKATSFDPSYISRIRAGKRGLPKHSSFLEPAAAYFAKRIVNDVQRKTLVSLIPSLEMIQAPDTEQIRRILLSWLSESDEIGSKSIRSLLETISETGSVSIPEFQIPDIQVPAELPQYYYGNSGKRAAVLSFLTNLSADGQPHNLFLHSDENMDWMYEDAGFAVKWALLLASIILHGGKIIIIHTINRHIEEMTEALNKWIPLYMTGAIEPYYCPRMRDGIYRRTIFLAEGHSAIISDSIGDMTNMSLNIMINESKACNALMHEFRAYLSFCHRLMEIETYSQNIFPENWEGYIPVSSPKIPKGLQVFYHDGDSFLLKKNEPPYITFKIYQHQLVQSLREYLDVQ